MQQEAFAVFAFDCIDDLLILTSTQCGDNNRLGFAAE